jgi:hypothetical protein
VRIDDCPGFLSFCLQYRPLSRRIGVQNWPASVNAPAIGNTRHAGDVDYGRIGGGPYAAESGIVVELGQSAALIVMGNQEPLGNVGTESLALGDSGLLVQRASNPFICVVEVRK